MKLTWWRLGFLLSVALNVGALGVAAYHQYGPPRGDERRAPGQGAALLSDTLQLTAEQVEGLGSLEPVLERRVTEARQRMRERRAAFFGLLAGPAVDPQAVREALKEMNAIQLEIQQAVADHLTAQFRVLSSEQRGNYLEVLRLRSAAGPGQGLGMGLLPLLDPCGGQAATVRR